MGAPTPETPDSGTGHGRQIFAGGPRSVSAGSGGPLILRPSNDGFDLAAVIGKNEGSAELPGQQKATAAGGKVSNPFQSNLNRRLRVEPCSWILNTETDKTLTKLARNGHLAGRIVATPMFRGIGQEFRQDSQCAKSASQAEPPGLQEIAAQNLRPGN